MFSLIRFFEEEKYLNDFLNGHLYMNSIGHFWKMGQPNVQDDLFEGTIEILSEDRQKELYGSLLSDTFGSHILLPPMNRLEGFQFVHVLCFYMNEYDPELQLAVSIPKNMNGFGKYAIRIRDMEGFVNLLFDKIESKRLYGIMGPVQYRNPKEAIPYMDCFDKSIIHKDEHEWRFALIPNFEKAQKAAKKLRNINETKAEQIVPYIYDKAIYFEIGDLRAFVEILDAESLVTDVGKTYGQNYKTVEKLPYTWENKQKQIKLKSQLFKIPYSYQENPYQYIGWTPREAFTRKVSEIDPGIKPILTIG